MQHTILNTLSIGNTMIVTNLMCGRAFHIVVERVCIHGEAAASPIYTTLRLLSPFALLLLSFFSPVASLFGTFGAELGGVSRALNATSFVTDLPSLSNSCSCCCLEEEREDKSMWLVVWYFPTQSQHSGAHGEGCRSVASLWALWHCEIQKYIHNHGHHTKLTFLQLYLLYDLLPCIHFVSFGNSQLRKLGSSRIL